jgi:LCP family protein required for cell wall assembly
MLEQLDNDNRPEFTKKKPVNFLDEKNPKQTKPKKRKKVFVFFILIVIIMSSVFAFRAFMSTKASNNPYEYDPVTLEPKEEKGFFKRISNFVFNREPSLEGQKDDRINILLLGIGGPGHNGPFLSDTMIISSIKPSTGQVAMISIPRDLGVEIPDYGTQKINHANAYGEAKEENNGASFAKEIVEDTFDIKIPYYVRVDFQAFIDIIDAVGGIKIDVERTFTDREFPAPNDQYQSLTFEKGVQTMDGKRALQYARSRHGNNNEGSDFARAKRQQKVILALKEKVLSFQTLANPIRISKIIKSLGDHITTNIEFSNMISFLKIGKSMEISDIITLVFDIEENGYLESGYTDEGAYILSPVTGDFDSMSDAIKDIFEKEGEKDSTPSQDTPAPKSVNIIEEETEVETTEEIPTEVEKEPQEEESNNIDEEDVEEIETKDNIEIQNGTWRAGMASRTKIKLKDENLKITDIGNTVNRPIPESGVYAIYKEISPETLEDIQRILNIQLKKNLPEGETYSSDTDILIILGEDFIE